MVNTVRCWAAYVYFMPLENSHCTRSPLLDFDFYATNARVHVHKRARSQNHKQYRRTSHAEQLIIHSVKRLHKTERPRRAKRAKKCRRNFASGPRVSTNAAAKKSEEMHFSSLCPDGGTHSFVDEIIECIVPRRLPTPLFRSDFAIVCRWLRVRYTLHSACDRHLIFSRMARDAMQQCTRSSSVFFFFS